MPVLVTKVNKNGFKVQKKTISLAEAEPYEYQREQLACGV